MKCPNCKAEIADDSRFCGECGCRIPEEAAEAEPETEENTAAAEEIKAEETENVTEESVQAPEDSGTEASAADEGTAAKATEAVPEPETKPETKTGNGKLKNLFSDKKLILIAAAALAVILLIAVIACVSANNGKDEIRPCQYYFRTNPEDNTTRIYLYGKCIGGKQDFRNLESAMYADDGITGVLCVSDDLDDEYLYTVNGKKVTRVDSDVSTVRGITSDGKTAIYLKYNDDGKNELFILNVKSGKSEKIAEASVFVSFAFSSNGKYLAYIAVNFDDGKTDGRLFVYDGKNKKELCKAETVTELLYGISDSGKLVYVSDPEGKMYAVNKKGEKNKLGQFSTLDGRVFLNRDGTQIMFSNDKGTYISRNGKEAEKYSSARTYAPLSMISGASSSPRMNGESVVVPVRNLRSEYWMVHSTKYSLVKFARNPDKNVTLISNVSNYNGINVLDNGKTVILFKDSKIRMSSLKYGDNFVDKAKEIVDDVKTYVISNDEKKIYYVNYDDELFVCKIAEDASCTRVTGEYYMNLRAINDRLVIFETEKGTFYGTKNVRKKLIGEELVRVFSDKNGVYFTDDDDSLLYATTASKAKKVKNK